MDKNRAAETVRDALGQRFGETFAVASALPGLDELARIAGHRVHRRYLDRSVDPALVRLLCACALSAPTKSDLQQCDIMIVADAEKRRAIADLIPDQPWVAQSPVFLVFLASGRRLPQIAQLRGKPFPNDHLDQFFNAAVDAALVLATFVRAAEAVGLGCCPISVIRDHAARVSELMSLPQRVIPVAGMCLGWPAGSGSISPRLSLQSTLHTDQYDDSDFARRIETYDRRRAALKPYAAQRHPVQFGKADFYGWSEDKARQYAEPQRADFGAFVRAKGFCLD
jgi:nitroreductase